VTGIFGEACLFRQSLTLVTGCKRCPTPLPADARMAISWWKSDAPLEMATNGKRLISATVITLFGTASFITWAGTLSSGADSSAAIGVISAEKLAKIVPGVSKAQVRALLGVPWRTVQYNDVDEIENEIWENRGRDPNGSYRLHIEFDKHDLVLLVGRIPDKLPSAPGAPARE